MKYKSFKSKKFTVVFSIFLFVIILTLSNTTEVKARIEILDGGTGASNSWTENASKDIYAGNGPTTIQPPAQQKEPGFFEKLLIEAVTGIANTLNQWCSDLYIDMNNVVFGRVGGGGMPIGNGSSKIALFTFELTRGNPYGIVASAVYKVLREIIYIILVCIIFAKVALSAYSGSSSKALEAFKGSIQSFVVSLVLLTTMPYFLDLFLYIRDVILYAVGIKGAQDLLGLGQNQSIVDAFANIANTSLLNSFMYLGSFVLNFYFAYIYVGIALSIVISVVAFPFVCINAQFDKNALNNWVKDLVSYAVIPIIDCTLLMVPATIGKIGSASPSIGVIQFLVCSMVIPARALLRTKLGLNSNMGLEMAGVATMLGASKMMGAAVGNTFGAIKNGVGALKSSYQDQNMANYYDELDEAQNNVPNDYSDMQRGGYNDGALSFNTEANGYGKDTSYALSNSIGSVEQYNDDFRSNGAYDQKGQASYDSSSKFGDYSSAREQNIPKQDPVKAVKDLYADINNFERPDFNGISYKRRAELYRERARKKRNEAVGATLGRIVGATAGAAIGFGSSMFLSPGTKGMMMGATINAGGNVGSFIGGSLGNLKRKSGNITNYSGDVSSETLGGGSGISEQTLPVMASQAGIEEINRYSNSSSGNSTAGMDAEYASFIINNKDIIKDYAIKANDFIGTPNKADTINEIYNNINSNINFKDSQDKYEEFRRVLENRMLQEFSDSLTNSNDIKWSGKIEKDKKIRENLVNSYAQRIRDKGYKNLSKDYLEGLGYTFE